MKYQSTALLLCMLLVALPAFAGNTGSLGVTKPTDHDATVQIHVVSGYVRVVGWAKDEVQVTPDLVGPGQRLQVSGNRKRLEISVVAAAPVPGTGNHASTAWTMPATTSNGQPGDLATLERQVQQVEKEARKAAASAASEASAAMIGTFGSPGIGDITVHVPRAARVEVTTIDAPISVRDIRGAQLLKSASGSIDTESNSSLIHARSFSGDITVEGSGQNACLHLGTVTGRIQVSGVQGDLTGQSMAGPFVVRKSRLRQASLTTTTGNVTFDSPLEASGNYEFNVWSGNLYLNVPPKPDAEFDLSTFSGKIHSDIGPKPKRSNPYMSGTELLFTSGNGSAYVHAKSMTGEINVSVNHQD